MSNEDNQNKNNHKSNSKKFAIKQFVVYGVLPSLVATFILGAITTICLLKALPTKIEELEEKIDNIIVSAKDMPSSNNVISEVDLYKFKEEVNQNVDGKLEKFDEKLDEK